MPQLAIDFTAYQKELRVRAQKLTQLEDSYKRMLIQTAPLLAIVNALPHGPFRWPNKKGEEVTLLGFSTKTQASCCKLLVCSAKHGKIEVLVKDLPLLSKTMSAPPEGVPLHLSPA